MKLLPAHNPNELDFVIKRYKGLVFMCDPNPVKLSDLYVDNRLSADTALQSQQQISKNEN
jgi:hypothetical protein